MNRYFIKTSLIAILILTGFWGCSKKGLTTADMLKYSSRTQLPAQEDFPNAGGVVLYENIETHITFNPRWQATKERDFHRAILYFNEKADPWLTPIIYLGKKDKLKNFHARTIKPNGETIELSKSDLHITPVKPDYVAFSDDRSVSFTFPGVISGAVVEYSYKIKLERSSFYGQTWKIQSRLPKLYSHFSIEFPKTFLTKKHSWTFLPVNINLEPPQQKERSRTSGLLDFKTITYSWEIRNIKAFRPGPQAPPYDDIAQYLRVDYKYKNWNALSKIYWNSIKDKFDGNVSDALKTLAQKIAGNAKTDAEKIGRVYAYLQKNYRYVAITIGNSGLIPNDPETIEKNKYGDCKDMTVLGTSLLKELDIKAYPALVKTRDEGRLSGQIVTFDFNHMITLAETATGKKYWLDATGSSCNLGEVYPSVEGTRALVIYPDGRSSFKKIPFSPASKNKVTRNVDLFLDNSGKIHGRAIITLTGNENIMARSRMRALSQEEIRGFVMRYANYNRPGMAIDSLSYDDPEVIAPSFTFRFNLKLPAIPLTGKNLMILNPAVFKINAHLDRFLNTERDYPVYFSENFTRDDKIILYYDPQFFAIDGFPEHIFKQYAFGRIRADSRKVGDGRVSYHLIYKITAPLIGAANYENFRELNKDLARSQDQKLALRLK